MNTREEVRRIAALLETVFRVAKLPIREFENRIGMGSGTLSRIFRGEIDLKFRHAFDVLNGLGIPPDRFFRMAYQDHPPAGEGLAREMMALLARAVPAGDPADEKGKETGRALISDEELDERILEALTKHGLVDRKKRRRPRKGIPPGEPAPPSDGGEPD